MKTKEMRVNPSSDLALAVSDMKVEQVKSLTCLESVVL